MKNRGFTLIELLVASSLFVLVVGFGMSLWISITRIQRGNIAKQNIYSESRFLINQLKSDIQAGQIAYDTVAPPYPNPAIPVQTELRILKKNGQIVRYFVGPSGVVQAFQRQVIDAAPPPPDVLSSPSITITRFDVYITPLVKTAGVAPMATIMWQAQDLKQDRPESINLQTTVSLRNY